MISREIYTDEFGVKCEKIWDEDLTVTPRKLRLNLCGDEQPVPKKLRLNLCGDDEETEIKTNKPFVETRTTEEILEEKIKELSKMYAARDELEKYIETNDVVWQDDYDDLEDIRQYIQELEYYFLSDEEKAEIDRMEQWINERIEHVWHQEEYEEMKNRKVILCKINIILKN